MCQTWMARTSYWKKKKNVWYLYNKSIRYINRFGFLPFGVQWVGAQIEFAGNLNRIIKVFSMTPTGKFALCVLCQTKSFFTVCVLELWYISQINSIHTFEGSFWKFENSPNFSYIWMSQYQENFSYPFRQARNSEEDEDPVIQLSCKELGKTLQQNES